MRSHFLRSTGATSPRNATGVCQIRTSSVTVGGVEYKFAASTEFKGAIFAGDTVKLHVIAGSDGSLTVREIEKVSGTSIGSGNSNGSDDNSNGNSNDDNGNDDHGNDNGGGNSNDDSKSGSNSNDG